MKKLLQGAALAIGFLSSSVFADVVVIVNKGNANAIASTDVSRLFLGKMKSFADGTSVKPINLSAGAPTRGEFEEKALGKSSSQIKAYWSKQVFSGKGKPPKELATDADVVSFVGATPGAIGYVDAASVNDSVKVIATF